MTTTSPITRIGLGDRDRVSLPRTKLLPGEMYRYGAPPKTALKPGILGKYDGPKQTAAQPGVLGKNDGQRRTALAPEDELRNVRPSSRKVGESEHEALTHQSERWVSQTFFGTLLRQMRQSPFKSELFSGGRGGQVFQEMYDQHLADHMAHSSGRKLAASIVKHIEKSRKQPPTAKGKTNSRGVLEADESETIPSRR